MRNMSILYPTQKRLHRGSSGIINIIKKKKKWLSLPFACLTSDKISEKFNEKIVLTFCFLYFWAQKCSYFEQASTMRKIWFFEKIQTANFTHFLMPAIIWKNTEKSNEWRDFEKTLKILILISKMTIYLILRVI